MVGGELIGDKGKGVVLQGGLLKRVTKIMLLTLDAVHSTDAKNLKCETNYSRELVHQMSRRCILLSSHENHYSDDRVSASRATPVGQSLFRAPSAAPVKARGKTSRTRRIMYGFIHSRNVLVLPAPWRGDHQAVRGLYWFSNICLVVRWWLTIRWENTAEHRTIKFTIEMASNMIPNNLDRATTHSRSRCPRFSGTVSWYGSANASMFPINKEHLSV